MPQNTHQLYRTCLIQIRGFPTASRLKLNQIIYQEKPHRDGHDSLLVKGHLKEHVADDGHGDLGQVCAKQECG